jgi:hypothetical protein
MCDLNHLPLPAGLVCTGKQPELTCAVAYEGVKEKYDQHIPLVLRPATKKVKYENPDTSLYSKRARTVCFKTNRTRLFLWISVFEVVYEKLLPDGFVSNITFVNNRELLITVERQDEITDATTRLWTIKMYITTGTVQIQGYNYAEWANDEFPLLLEMVNGLSKNTILDTSHENIMSEAPHLESDTCFRSLETYVLNHQREVRDRLDEFEESINQKMTDITKKQQTLLGDSKTKYVNQTNDTETLLKRIINLEKESSNLRASCTLHKELEQKNDIIINLTRENASLHALIQEKDSELKLARNHWTTLQANQETLTKKTTYLQERIDSLQFTQAPPAALAQPLPVATQNVTPPGVANHTTQPGDQDSTAVPQWSAPKPRVALLGDSITEGLDIKRLFTESTDGIYRRYGTIATVKNNIQSIISKNPKAIVIHVGINDLKDGKSADHATQEMTELVDTITTANSSTKIILSDILPSADTNLTRRTETYNAMIHEHLADRNNVSFTHHYNFVRFGQREQHLFDRDHPTHLCEHGCRVLAGNIKTSLARIMPDMGFKRPPNISTWNRENQGSRLNRHGPPTAGPHHPQRWMPQQNR